MAVMGDVARMATKMNSLTPGCTAPMVVRGWFTDDNDGFEQELARLAGKVMRSSTQLGSGWWLHAIPSLQQFKCASPVLKVMLPIRLCLVLGFTDTIVACKCGMRGDAHMQQGRHWMTKCPKAHRIIVHNKTRDVVAAIYKALHIHVSVEVRGLYAQLTPYGEHKLADVLVPPSGTGVDKAEALDITITDPTTKTAIENKTDKQPLKAAELRHNAKLGTNKKTVEEAGAQGLPFTKKPLVFETTGAMGKETHKWWQSILTIEKEHLAVGGATSRRE